MSLTLVQSRWQGWVVRSQRCRRHHRKIQTIARLSPPVVIASALFVEARGCRRGSKKDPPREHEARERNKKKDDAACDDSKSKRTTKDEADADDRNMDDEDEAARRGIRSNNFARRRRCSVRSRGCCPRSSRFLEDHRQGRRCRRSAPDVAPFRLRFDRVAPSRTHRKRRDGGVSLFASRDHEESRSLIPLVLLLSSDEDEDDLDLSGDFLLSAIAR